jgi:hypothetical protein
MAPFLAVIPQGFVLFLFYFILFCFISFALTLLLDLPAAAALYGVRLCMPFP